jgi:hypothetical protein
MHKFSVGMIVDLSDALFGWRGSYEVVKQTSSFEKVKIKNVKTGSQQFVSPEKLRMGRLPPFCIQSLQDKQR